MSDIQRVTVSDVPGVSTAEDFIVRETASLVCDIEQGRARTAPMWAVLYLPGWLVRGIWFPGERRRA